MSKEVSHVRILRETLAIHDDYDVFVLDGPYQKTGQCIGRITNQCEDGKWYEVASSIKSVQAVMPIAHFKRFDRAMIWLLDSFDKGLEFECALDMEDDSS